MVACQPDTLLQLVPLKPAHSSSAGIVGFGVVVGGAVLVSFSTASGLDIAGHKPQISLQSAGAQAFFTASAVLAGVALLLMHCVHFLHHG